MGVERKVIPEADFAVISGMDERQDGMIRMHARIRRDFLRAEAVLIKELGSLERDFKVFITGLAKSLEIEDEDLKGWRIDLNERAFLRDVEDPVTEELPVVVEEEAAPEPVPEESLLDKIRKKYKGK